MKTPLTHEQKAALIRRHADRLVDLMPLALAKMPKRPEVTTADGDILVQCGWLCCDDPAWAEGNAWLLWFVCGPLGYDCPCYDGEEPPEVP